MNGIIESVLNFLFTDVKDKKETKDLAVFIRVICVIYAVYYLIVGITVSYFQFYYIGLVMVAAIGLLCMSFICTYENHTKLGLIILNAVLIVFSTLLAFYVGYDLEFHIPAFITILLIYFNKSDKMVFKRFFTIGICGLLLVLAEVTNEVGARTLDSSFGVVFFRFINIIVVTCSLGIVAYCYCTKFNQAEDKLRSINENLERMANLDTLTGLSNRRHMNEHLTELVYEYNRSGRIFTLAIGDVDFFKKVNDTYGHDTGDFVLTTLADMFSEHMKNKGHVARWGGEEFLFAFENTTLDKAYKALDELREKIEKKPIHFKEYDFNITMSYGIEEFNDRLGVEVTIKKADEKLYKAKTTGRNKVVK